MRQRECTKCNVVKDDTEFSPMKTKPIFKYRWCDECRATQKGSNTYIAAKTKVLIAEDYRTLRQKAVERRKFNPEQCAELKRRIGAGEKRSALAKEFKVSYTTISKASRGYKS